jgi:hypothetical protein
MDKFASAPKIKDSVYYPEFDAKSGSYGVFGAESGFCYASFSDESDAKIEAGRMNRAIRG